MENYQTYKFWNKRKQKNMERNKLQLTRKSANERINHLFDQLKKQYPISIKQSNKKYGKGLTTIANNDNTMKITLHIGTKFSTLPMAQDLDIPLSDFKFLQVITTTFHEIAHVEQQTEIFQQINPSNSDIGMTINNTAIRNNYGYYKAPNGYNYKHNPNEIHAEFQSILSTYMYLQREFSLLSQEECTDIMLKYINQRQNSNDGYWIHSSKPFTSIEEIEKAFEQAYIRSFQTKRIYDPTNKINKNDENISLMTKIPEIISKFQNCKTGYEQDTIMACIACHLHPEYKQKYQTLQSIDLSPEMILDMSLPKESFYDNTYEIQQDKISTHDRATELEAQYEDKFDAKPSELDTSLDYPS